MNRRNLLTGTARALAGTTLAIGGAVAKSSQLENSTPAPDAELIAVCAEFDALERQSCIINGTGPDCVPDDAEADRVSAPIRARMHALLDRMDELRAASPAGIQARAHCLAQHAGHLDYSFDYPETMVGRLLIYLMRDAAALGGMGASVAVAASPDADLLATCAAFDALERASLATYDTYADCPEDSLEWKAGDAERDRCSDEQEPLLARMCELRAITRAGQVARAHSLALWDGDLRRQAESGCNPTAAITYAIVRDLIGGTA